MAAWQFAKLLFRAGERGWTRFVAMQNHYNLVYREEEREMIPLCLDQGIDVIPFSPLARGFLAGNRKRDGNRRGGDTTRAKTDQFAQQDYYEEVDFRIVEHLTQLAAKRGVKPAQLAYAWVASRPGVTAPIVGVSRVDQLEEAVTALSLRLNDEECRNLEEAYVPRTPRG